MSVHSTTTWQRCSRRASVHQSPSIISSHMFRCGGRLSNARLFVERPRSNKGRVLSPLACPPFPARAVHPACTCGRAAPAPATLELSHLGYSCRCMRAHQRPPLPDLTEHLMLCPDPAPVAPAHLLQVCEPRPSNPRRRPTLRTAIKSLSIMREPRLAVQAVPPPAHDTSSHPPPQQSSAAPRSARSNPPDIIMRTSMKMHSG